MLEKIQKIIADYKDLDPASVTPDRTFSDLGLDSLDVVELAMKFEEEFNVTIEVSEGFKTVGDILAAVQKD